MNRHGNWNEELGNHLLQSGEKEGFVDLKTERERVVWRRGEEDSREFMRGLSVRQGYTARGVKVPPVTATPAEELHFYQKAWLKIGPLTSAEDALYLRAFRNTCLEGYPHKDS
ncbi:MAG: hypothetical protein KBD66_02110 [Candidatus Doudnabacteria bacterium]|nr:hypothetical protein [Candidatus Doudnabacteria bacterium]